MTEARSKRRILPLIFIVTRKGGSEKVVGLGRGLRKFVNFKPTGGGGGGSKKIEPLARGAAKISSFKFQYLHTPSTLSY